MRNWLVLGFAGLAVGSTGCSGFSPLTLAPASNDASDDVMQVMNPDLHAAAVRYFPGQESTQAPARLFRLTRQQLDVTTKSLLPRHVSTAVSASMPKDPLQTNYEYADVLNFNQANFPAYAKWVETIAASVRTNPSGVIDCPSGASTSACLEEQARKFVVTAFRGSAPRDRVDAYVQFFLANASQVGVAEAAGDLVDVVLSSPHYLFREEIRTDGTKSLLPSLRLQNVTYTLADAPPEKLKLSSAAPETYVQSPESLRTTIDRVLATPEARDKLLRFFAAWLEIKEADEFTISPVEFPEFDATIARAVVDETKRFLQFHLSKAAPKLKDLTQSNQSFVSRSIASIYEMNSSGLTGNELVDLDPSKRIGLFTQPAVIASHSGPSTTRLVKRGVFFTRKVMCLEIGGVPSGVDTSVPETSGMTERQRIEAVTNQSRCLGCHSFINPFGFIQENYDPIGRWRETDEGLPVDSRITVDFLDEGRLDTSSPVEAMRAFTSSLRFKQCFVRQLFRFYMGRQEQPSDDPLLRQMFFHFAQGDDQDILGLLRILANSERFARRTEVVQ